MMGTGLFYTGGAEGEPAVEWPGDRIDGVSYPRNIGAVWSDVDLASIGLAKPLDADDVPDGKQSTAKVVRTVNGVPKWVSELEDVPPPSPEEIGSEVQNRIFARASQNTQMNMSAARAAGIMGAGDQAAFVEALTWVAQMRATGAALAASQDPTFRDDKHWPEPSAAALALVAKY